MAATIVLADDDADLRAVYAPWLRSAGYEVHEAGDGHEALGLVRSRRPDLLLLDLWMPGASGFEVLDALRHEPAAGHVKVVVLSCQCDGDSKLECFGVGACGFLAKGLPLTDLLEAVRRTLAEPEVAAGPA